MRAQPRNDYDEPRSEIAGFLKSCRRIFWGLAAFSGLSNLLMLTGSFFMLQVYDRALTSGSVPTLLALSMLAIGLYFFQGLFEVIRSQVLVRMGARLDKRIAPLAHRVAIDMPRFGFSNAEALERGRDVDTVRSFLGSQLTRRCSTAEPLRLVARLTPRGGTPRRSRRPRRTSR